MVSVGPVDTVDVGQAHMHDLRPHARDLSRLEVVVVVVFEEPLGHLLPGGHLADSVVAPQDPRAARGIAFRPVRCAEIPVVPRRRL